ncbi:MAG: SDR family NAD(P)-dependent oxidoreductase, partial [Anaerolineae bacterium]|nr:SDR family NAD(P)-dependent oxidoreductase [Anaerolineae bacterium]
VFATIREAYGIPRREDLKLRDYNTLNKVVGFVYEMRPDGVKRETLAVGGQPSAVGPQPSQIAGNRMAGARQIPRRVPWPTLRPGLDLCKPSGVTLGAGDRVIVVGDQGSVGKYLGYRLRPRKVKALTLKNAAPEAAEAQVAAWLEEGPITGVYFLTGLDPAPSIVEMSLAQWQAEQAKRAKLMYAVIHKLTQNTFLVCATRMGGLHGYGEAGASQPLGGAVTGFAKAYAQERRETLVKAVDFEIDADERKIAEILVNETLGDLGAVEIGCYRGQRFGIGLIERPVDDERFDVHFNPDMVFLVTGGAGGISVPIVADLAGASLGTFYLTGRTPMPDPTHHPDLARLEGEALKFLKRDIAQRIKDGGQRPTPVLVDKEIAALERQKSILDVLAQAKANGGRAHYRLCDVTDARAVLALIDEIRQVHGRLDVVIHAAGVERSHLLPDKSAQEFAQVYDIKADGFFNLLKACASLTQAPQAVIAYSSISGRFGNAGQTDYSAANDLMCKIVSSMQGGPTKAIAIDWSAWAKVGMATRGSIPEMMKQAGIELIRPEHAAPTVRREIVVAGTGGEVVVAHALGFLTQGRDLDGGIDWEKANAQLAHDFPVAGKATALDTFGTLTFEAELDPQEPFLRDHAIDDIPLLPGVMGVEGFAEVACLAASRLGGGQYRIAAIKDVQFKTPVKFYRQQPRALRWRVQVSPSDEGLVAYVRLESRREIQGRCEDTPHFGGCVHLVPSSDEDVPPMAQPPMWNGAATVEPAAIYRIYFHGPAFQVLEGVQSAGGRVVGKFNTALPPMTARQASTLTPPLLIELCLQTAGVWEIGKTGTMALPVAIDRVVVHRSETNSDALYAEITPRQNDKGQLCFDGCVVDGEGNVYLEMEGYHTARLSSLDDEALLAPLKKIVGE